MVEHAVDDDFNAHFVHFFHQLGEVFVRLFKVGFIGYAADIFRRVAVVLFPALHIVVEIVLDYGKMRVDIVVVLRVVLVVGRRHEQRVEVHRLNSEIFKVLQLLFHALQIAAVKVVDVERVGNSVPVMNFVRMSARIVILVVANVVLRIAVAEAVDVNLIEHPALRPVGHLEVGSE